MAWISAEEERLESAEQPVALHPINRSAAKGQAREELIDSLLVTAEEEPGKRFWTLLHLKNGRIDVLVREDRQKRPNRIYLSYSHILEMSNVGPIFPTAENHA